MRFGIFRWSKTLAAYLLVAASVEAAAPENNWDCRRGEAARPGWSCSGDAAVENQPLMLADNNSPASAATQTTPRSTNLAGSPPAIAHQPGWNCTTDAESAGWDCALIGPDPKGLLHSANETVSAAERVYKLDELRRYESMVNFMPADPWTSCNTHLGHSQPLPTSSLPEKLPIDIQADYTDIFEEEIVTFSGNVDVTHGVNKVFADSISYDTVTEGLNARGNVHYRGTGISMFSDSAFMDLQNNRGNLRNVQFIYDSTPARGGAQFAKIESKTLSRYRDANFTTCRPGNSDWELQAKYLELDKESGRGVARQAWVEFKGVPFLYTPYISFPLDDRRKSGFLAPHFGSSDENGFDFQIPYYLNIAPNLDATIAPRILSNRGLLLGGEFRYLTEVSSGKIEGEWLPYDRKSKGMRGQLSLFNFTRFAPNIVSDMNLNYVSDDKYLDEIGDALNISNTSHVHSQANLRYSAENFSLLARLENYQTIDADNDAFSRARTERREADKNVLNDPDNDNLIAAAAAAFDNFEVADADRNKTREYRRLPQILFNFNERIGNSDGRFDLRSEFVYFQRNGRTSGQRLDIKPSFSLPIRTASTFLTPKLTLQHTQYWLDRDDKDRRPDKSNRPSSIDRTLPIVSLDAGIFMERYISWGDTKFLQTLDPRLFYLYIPRTNQDDIPLFDTTEYDFRFSQLFRENRFVGGDRIGDANQLAVTVSSDIIDPLTGRQRLSGKLGGIVYFQDRKVALLPGTKPDNRFTSSLIGELDVYISDHWSFLSSLQWDPNETEIERGNLGIRYRNGQARIFNLGYRYRSKRINTGVDEGKFRTIIDQSDLSFRWPVTDSLYAVGRWQYSFRHAQHLEAFAGFEKENCCWRIRLIGRHWVNDADKEANTGVFLQMELKGLTAFGNRVDRFLEKNISGYRIPE